MLELPYTQVFVLFLTNQAIGNQRLHRWQCMQREKASWRLMGKESNILNPSMLGKTVGSYIWGIAVFGYSCIINEKKTTTFKFLISFLLYDTCIPFVVYIISSVVVDTDMGRCHSIQIQKNPLQFDLV